MSDTTDIIDKYQAAYSVANPGKVVPDLVYRNGWVELRSPFLSRYRRRQIEAMTERLLARAAALSEAQSTGEKK